MHEIRINLDEELYYTIKEDAARKVMNLSEYFRDLLMKQSGVELTIDFADVYKYIEQIEQLTRKVDSILPKFTGVEKFTSRKRFILSRH